MESGEDGRSPKPKKVESDDQIENVLKSIFLKLTKFQKEPVKVEFFLQNDDKKIVFQESELRGASCYIITIGDLSHLKNSSSDPSTTSIDVLSQVAELTNKETKRLVLFHIDLNSGVGILCSEIFISFSETLLLDEDSISDRYHSSKTNRFVIREHSKKNRSKTLTSPFRSLYKIVKTSSSDKKRDEDLPALSDKLSDLEIPLFPGETVTVTKQIVCALDNKKKPGTLYITNFRLLFVDIEKISLCVPLTNISQIKKIGGKSGKETSLYGIRVETKDLRTFFFLMPKVKHSRKEILLLLKKACSPSPTELFAFSVNFQLPSNSGWSLYDPIGDYQRIGFPDSNWRITEINKNYKISLTYPEVFVVPQSISDEDLRKVASFRSKGRIPACVWKHSNGAVILRSSQPMVGVSRARCVEDEKLLNMAIENVASKHLYIADARPKVNAQANMGMGMGYEIVPSIYSNCIIEFHNIANIHVMRDSLKKLKKTCLGASNTDKDVFRRQVESTEKVLACAVRMVTLVDKEVCPVLSHCSDGWDRTSQAVALAEMLLDPYYRTFVGFQQLIEKEFLSFGHKIAQRSGHYQDISDFGDKERSPVFLQFIDSVSQLLIQFPTAFEFNSKLLVTILDHLHSCLFGTFLLNCDRERKEALLSSKTLSFWDFVSANSSHFLNPDYKADSSVLYPDTTLQAIQLWSDYYTRFNTGLSGIEMMPHNFVINT